jgi:hypothetical protein
MNINNWRNFLTESKQSSEKLLREVSEDELGHIQQALDEMDNEDLAFNKIFDGKMRVVIDFPTMDTKSDLGRFVDFFRDAEYQVDWNKGIMSGEKELSDSSTENLVRQLTGEPPIPPKKKKIQMKIGKFFKKISELTTKRNVYFQKIAQHSEEHPDLGRVPEHPGQATGNQVKAALDEKELLNYQRLSDHLDMYLPQIKYRSTPEWGVRMSDYWQKNAEYIKREVENLRNDNYAIIITRHPIDVLRMSDFDGITSCHSPPSQGGSGETYYKCAVAEAHGHGAVAYVVEMQQLKEWAGQPDYSLEEIESEMQSGEIFEDDKRWDAGTVTPVSRLRLRQVRYYEATQTGVPKTDDYKKAGRNPFDGIQLAIPEKRIYGEKIPGIRERVMVWAKEAQQEQLMIVKRDSEPDNSERVIQLDKFIKFGGSYEDNQISDLISSIFDEGDGLGANTAGSVVQDRTTEDELEVNLVGSLLEQWQEQIDQSVETWNARYQAVEVSGEAEDDGGGGTYISPRAAFEIKWDADEWETMPGWQEASYAVSELNDIGWGWADSDGASLRSRPYGEDGKKIVLIFPIVMEGVPDSNGMGFANDPEDFEDLCVALNAIDDMYDGVKEYVERYFKGQGYMSGGAIGNLAREILDGDIDTEWDLETDDRYDWDEVTQIDATAKFDFGAFDPPLPEHNPQIMQKIAEDRDFQIQFRKAIHASTQEKMNTQYFVNTHWRVSLDSSNDIIMECNLRVNDHGNDEQVAIFEQIITDNYDLDGLRDSVLRPLVIQAMNSRMPSGMQSSFNENARIVKSWKSFLKG